MTAETPTSPAASAPAEPKPNSFARIFGVLFSPGETFASIARRPDWVMPLLVIVIIGYIGTVIIMPRIDWDAMVTTQTEQIKKQNPNLPDERIERMARIGVSVGKVLGWIGPFLGVIAYLIVAAVLLLAFRLFGGEGNFAQAFSATLYGWMPRVIGSIVVTIVVLLRGSVDPMQIPTLVKSNPAFLVDMKTQPLLFALLSSFDIFAIWTIVLLIIGFAALSRTSKAKAASIVLPLWFIVILVKLIGPALQSIRK